MILCTFENGGTGNLRHVIVDGLVFKNDKILFVKRDIKLSEGGKWGVPGGYVNLNENLEEAIIREVFEETGYRVSDLKLFTIIDNPKRRNDEKQNIGFVFICNALEKDGEPDKESTEQKWFDLDNLPSQEEMAFDHSQIIKAYLRNKNSYIDSIKV
jgi:8-oxo-dGTP diphosphatase